MKLGEGGGTYKFGHEIWAKKLSPDYCLLRSNNPTSLELLAEMTRNYACES